MKKYRNKVSDELRPEYDLRKLLNCAARSKYAKRCRAGTNAVFRDERAVNEALRLVIELRKVGSRSSGVARKLSPLPFDCEKRPL